MTRTVRHYLGQAFDALLRHAAIMKSVCLILSLMPRIIRLRLSRGGVPSLPHVLIATDAIRTGGIERVLGDTNEILTSRGYRVSFVLLDNQISPITPIPKDTTTVLGWHGFTVLIYKFVVHVLRERPDYVYAANPLVLAVACVAKIVLLGKMRLIVRLDNDYGTCIEYDIRTSGTMTTFSRQMRRTFWLLWIPNRVVAIESSLLVNYKKLSKFPARWVVLRNPSDLHKITKMSHEEVHHPWLDGYHDVMISVGRLIPSKNHEMLLRSFAILHQRRDDIRLVIAGDGTQMNQLKAQAQDLGIADLVDFLGDVANPYSIIKRSNVLVVTSYHEGGPLVVVEAMACGVPVVITNTTSASNAVDGGRYGEIVEVDDDAAMIDAVERALDTPTDPDLLWEAVQRYSIDKHADELCGILDAIR